MQLPQNVACLAATGQRKHKAARWKNLIWDFSSFSSFSKSCKKLSGKIFQGLFSKAMFQNFPLLPDEQSAPAGLHGD